MRRLARAAFALGAVFVVGVGARSADPDVAKRAEDLATKSTVVFKGTVTEAKASNVAVAAKSDNTHLVRIDELVAPSADVKAIFDSLVGQDITVYDEPPAGTPVLKAGDKALFFTNVWLYADKPAVRTEGRMPVDTAVTGGDSPPAGGAPPAGDPPVATPSAPGDAALARYVAAAPNVVVGKVTEVRQMQGPRQVAVASAEGVNPQALRPPSEHLPRFQEAVVEVKDVVKGGDAQKKIIVVFAASRDVVWHKSPKFVVGQEGLFTLHKSQIPDANLARAVTAVANSPADAGSAGVYTALDPRDFQPLEGVGEAATAAAQTRRVVTAVKDQQKK